MFSRSLSALKRLDAFVQCQPSITPYLLQSLSSPPLSLPSKSLTASSSGGVTIANCTPRQLYAANLYTPTASRVLLRLGTFPEIHTPDQILSSLKSAIPDLEAQFNLSSKNLHFRITSSHSTLKHTKAIEERLLTLLQPTPPLPTAPPQLILVRLIRNTLYLSLDSSGSGLHTRGYRSADDFGKAPLRESIASALLLAANYDPEKALIDPFCGSGTLLIEAALQSRPHIHPRLMVGRETGFSFKNWPSFSNGAFASLVGSIPPPLSPLPPQGLLLGLDRDAGVISAAKRNAERAGVGDLIEFRCAALSHLPDVLNDAAAGIEGGGLVLTNPPWGARVSPNTDLRNLYSTLGQIQKKHLPNFALGVFTGTPALVTQLKLPLVRVLDLKYGGQAPSLYYCPARYKPKTD